MAAHSECKVGDCDKRVFSRGWCSAHYNKWQRYGDPLSEDRVGHRFSSREFSTEEESAIVSAYTTGATVAGLSDEYKTGWTQIARILRTHDVYEGRQRSHRDREAQVICERYQAGESLSEIGRAVGRSNAWLIKVLEKHGIDRRAPGAPVPDYVPRIRELREAGLGARKIAAELGIGVTTAQKWLRRWGMSSPQHRAGPGPDSPLWKGGLIEVNGYRAVWLPADDPLRVMAWRTGYALEHRLVMARSLGRPLERRETVHHINGDPRDNRLENLQLRSGRHGKGARYACLDCGSHNVGPVPL